MHNNDIFKTSFICRLDARVLELPYKLFFFTYSVRLTLKIIMKFKLQMLHLFAAAYKI